MHKNVTHLRSNRICVCLSGSLLQAVLWQYCGCIVSSVVSRDVSSVVRRCECSESEVSVL